MTKRDKFHRDVLLPYGAQVGGESNYLTAASDGYLTLTGTARVKRDIWIKATDFYMDSASATGGGGLFSAGSMQSASLPLNIGASIWSQNAGSDLGVPVVAPAANVTGSPVFAVAAFPVPPDAATAGSITALVDWSVLSGNATSGCSYVIKAALTYLSSSALARTAASAVTCASYKYTDPGYIHESTIGTFPSFGANDKVAVLQIASDQTNASDTGGSNVAFLGVKLRYVANSFGSQSSE